MCSSIKIRAQLYQKLFPLLHINHLNGIFCAWRRTLEEDFFWLGEHQCFPGGGGMGHPTEEKKQALYSACKHFICIDFNGIPAFHKCHFRDLTAPRSEKIMWRGTLQRAACQCSEQNSLRSCCRTPCCACRWIILSGIITILVDFGGLTAQFGKLLQCRYPILDNLLPQG